MIARPLRLPLRLARMHVPGPLRPWLALAGLAGIDATFLHQTGITLTADPVLGPLLLTLARALGLVAFVYGVTGRSLALSACADLPLRFLVLTILGILWSALVVQAWQRPGIDPLLRAGDQRWRDLHDRIAAVVGAADQTALEQAR